MPPPLTKPAEHFSMRYRALYELNKESRSQYKAIEELIARENDEDVPESMKFGRGKINPYGKALILKLLKQVGETQVPDQHGYRSLLDLYNEIAKSPARAEGNVLVQQIRAALRAERDRLVPHRDFVLGEYPERVKKTGQSDGQPVTIEPGDAAELQDQLRDWAEQPLRSVREDKGQIAEREEKYHNALKSYDVTPIIRYAKRIKREYDADKVRFAPMKPGSSWIRRTPFAIEHTMGEVNYVIALSELTDVVGGLAEGYNKKDKKTGKPMMMTVDWWEGSKEHRTEKLKLAVERFEKAADYYLNTDNVKHLDRKTRIEQVKGVLNDLVEVDHLDTLKERYKTLKVSLAIDARNLTRDLAFAYRQGYEQHDREQFTSNRNLNDGEGTKDPYVDCSEVPVRIAYEAAWAQSANYLNRIISHFEPALANPTIDPDANALGKHTARAAKEKAKGSGGRGRGGDPSKVAAE